MANKALLPMLLIGGAVAAVAMTAQASDEPGPEPDNGGAKPGPGRPVLEGGKIVLRGFKTNQGGVKITFQIEQIEGDPSPKGSFFGVIFEAWAGNNPALVAQATTRQGARDKTLAFIDTDPHGLPG